jgi:hypothetical protein
MKLEERYQDLAEIVKGASFNQLFSFFYTLALLKYAVKDQLNQINNKLGTKKKLQRLVALDYLAATALEVYTITDKTLGVLANVGLNTKIIQRPGGQGEKERLAVSEAILKIMSQADFFTVIYPEFKEAGSQHFYLVPDAALIFKRENRAQLVFLEVEAQKHQWLDYLAQKRQNYQQLACNYETYNLWWRYQCQLLGFNLGLAAEFCFSVLVIGRFKPEEEWPGWQFSANAGSWVRT